MADNNDINKQLMDAAYNGHADTVRDLIQRQGANFTTIYNGCTPMYIAAANGHVKVVRTLGELGANPNLARTDTGGVTPILMAAVNGHVEVVRALGELGADPNLATETGATPIFAASQWGMSEVVRVLGQLGADPNLAMIDGRTPIFAASQWGKLEVVRVLGEFGADPNLARTSDGTTPIFAAAWEGHVDVVCALIQLGADDTQLDQDVRSRVSVPPQLHREQIRIELDDKIEEVQIIELVADFVGPLCDPKRRKAYIVECAQHRAEIKKQKQK